MTRIDAYREIAPAGSLQGLARALSHPGGVPSTDVMMERAEPWLRRAVPVMILLFVGMLIAMAVMQARQSRDDIIEDAMAEIELMGALVAAGADAASRNGEVPAETVLPLSALAHDRRILVGNAAGDIQKAFPALLPQSPANLAAYLGNAQLLTVFAEKAGVMRIGLAEGEDVLATVRTLPASQGQIAVIQPIRAVLAEWQAQAIRTGVALGSTTLVIVMLTGAFLWQGGRARGAEQVCRRVRERIDTALNRGRCGLWDWDIARGRIYWSSSMYSILGMKQTADFISFGDISSLMHPDDGDLSDMAEMLAASRTDKIDRAFRLRNTAGEWVWLRARAQRVEGTAQEGVHLVGIAVDISEQKRLAEHSATADMRLRDAIETVSEAFVLWDADNKLVMCNTKFQKLHNLPADAVVQGTPYGEVMARGTQPEIQDQISIGERLRTGARSYAARLADGRWLQVNERRTNDGGYVSVGTDISKLKQNEGQLMESERRLTATVADLRRSRQTLELQAQQLADLAERYLEQKAEAENANLAKSEFLANMSHELRTPLTHILGFAEMMQHETFGPLGHSKYAEYSHDIGAAGSYLLGVISDVLDMSQLEAGQIRLRREEFDIGDAVAAAVAGIREVCEAKNITLLSEAANGASVTADRQSVEKILATLLRNAVKFTPDGGRVTVRTRQVGQAMNIYVEDTGVGIAADELPRIGRPFEQPVHAMEDGMKGSGLGLAIARALIDLHNGSLRIRSTPGAGTIMQVHLPATKSMATPRMAFAVGM